MNKLTICRDCSSLIKDNYLFLYSAIWFNRKEIKTQQKKGNGLRKQSMKMKKQAEKFTLPNSVRQKKSIKPHF